MVIHSMVVLISLYPMDFVSLDKFFMDLKEFIPYHFDSGHVGRAIQYMRRGGLLMLDTKGNKVGRGPLLKSYIQDILKEDKHWQKILEEWISAHEFVERKYHQLTSVSN